MKLIYLFTLFITIQGVSQTDTNDIRLQLVEKGVISTYLYERDMAISPDGREMFYTILLPSTGRQMIMHRVRNHTGKWSEPEVANFSGIFNDLEPAFDPSANKLFFTSNRPVSGTKAKDYDIWYAEKLNGQWQKPVNAGAPVNTTANEFYPSIAKNGNLYFTASYMEGKGREDIYCAVFENGQYTTPVSLDNNINSPHDEFNAFIDPDERFILYSSWGRPDDKGRGDLYISIRDSNDHWLPAKNLVILNSASLDYCPFVSPDKKTLYFTSERYDDAPAFKSHIQIKIFSTDVMNGSGNIFAVDFEKIINWLHHSTKD